MDQDPTVNYFYTSCTRNDGWPSLSRFHADLEYRLKAQEGLWVAGVLGPQTGSGPVLEGAVTQVGVLVALYSPDYFRDRDCGLEWAVFRRRMAHQELTAAPDVASCLIPLLWKPLTGRRPRDTPRPWRPDGLPDAGSPAGRLYEREGLSGLMSSPSPEANDLYFALIGLLARRIAQARTVGLPALDAAELPTLEPAFGTHTSPIRRWPPVGAGVVTRGSGAARGFVTGGSPGSGGSGRAGGSGMDADARGNGESPPPQPPLPRSVAISYVGADQPWADWMAEVLTADGGAEVEQVRWRTELESLSTAITEARRGAEVVIVVFSRSYFAAGEQDPYQWEEVFFGRGARDLIAVQIDAEPRPLLVRQGVPVTQLGGSGDSQAERLRELVRDPGPVVPAQREGEGR